MVPFPLNMPGIEPKIIVCPFSYLQGKQTRYFMKHIISIPFVFFALHLSTLAQTFDIIPEPQEQTAGKGFFKLSTNAAISYNNMELQFLAGYLKDMVKTGTKIDLKSQSGSTLQQGKINLLLDPKANGGKEGYELKVSEGAISVKASTPRGVFYGVQTLLQLIPADGSTNIPAVSIKDAPRFPWRGLMLDVSRHFFTIDQVKRMIDQMVRYKFNLLHLHLTDDQGWRMEIKQLPELTSVGAWRVPRTGLWWERDCPKEGEAATYGGFYTQQELKALIAYASERFVDVLPEIDVPGHSLAAIAAYPYLSSTGLNYKVNPGCKFYTIEDNALCVGKESTFEFLDKVFTEVANVFPFEYIHIGGDECFKGFWKKCADCQKRMKDNGLKNTEELQSYFIKRLEKMLDQKGKKLMGWDEILEGGLAPKASVMSWRGMAGGITAAKENHHVVMSPTDYAYLDLYQGDPAIEPPTYSMLRFKTVYEFEPVPDGVDPAMILGGQGNLWTESVPTFRQAEYMLWPRSFALSEVLWSSTSSRNWNRFVEKTEAHFARLDQADINYAKSVFDAAVIPSKNAQGQLQIKVETEVEALDVYYTFDNTYPDHHSAKYKKGDILQIPKDADHFRVITYRNGKPLGRMLTLPLDELIKRVKK
jgi:hexosaminidase